MGAQPHIGGWYRAADGNLFEVVAVDKDDRTIEVQYFDGTVEELDLEDWHAQCATGEIEEAGAPEESGSVDADLEADDDAPSPNGRIDGDQQMAGGLDGLDVFEGPDVFN